MTAFDRAFQRAMDAAGAGQLGIRTRPPVHVKKKKSLGPGWPKLYGWVCTDKFHIAKFEHRKHPNLTAMVHRSTKNPGMWQTTFFNENGPISDLQRSTCEAALSEVPPRVWRLRAYTPKK